ncbi:hypothetical protein AZF37_06120 [endosymbiont 'TC1' of Trimyema compressum]|nr:hypothetical protein AZF37_06120 [endosymbiont 'TC1' of Trimyema compressum]
MGLAKATGDKSQIMGVEISGNTYGNEKITNTVVKPYTGLKISGDYRYSAYLAFGIIRGYLSGY